MKLSLLSILCILGLVCQIFFLIPMAIKEGRTQEVWKLIASSVFMIGPILNDNIFKEKTEE